MILSVKCDETGRVVCACEGAKIKDGIDVEVSDDFLAVKALYCTLVNNELQYHAEYEAVAKAAEAKLLATHDSVVL